MINAGFYALFFNSIKQTLSSSKKLKKIAIQSHIKDIFGFKTLNTLIVDTFGNNKTTTIQIACLEYYQIDVKPTGTTSYDPNELEMINKEYSSIMFNSPLIGDIYTLDLAQTDININNQFDMIKYMADHNVKRIVFPVGGHFNMNTAFQQNDISNLNFGKTLQTIKVKSSELPQPEISHTCINVRSESALTLNFFDIPILYNGKIEKESDTDVTLSTYAAFHRCLNLYETVETAEFKCSFYDDLYQNTQTNLESMENIFYTHSNFIPNGTFSFQNLKKVSLNFEHFVARKSVSVNNIFARVARDLKQIISAFYSFRLQKELEASDVDTPRDLKIITVGGSFGYEIKPDSNNQTITTTRKDIKLTFLQSSDSKTDRKNREKEQTNLMHEVTKWSNIPKENQVQELPRSTVKVKYEIDFVFH